MGQEAQPRYRGYHHHWRKRRYDSLYAMIEDKLTITGMLSAFMGFIEEGDEVIIFEPFFDQQVSAQLRFRLQTNLL
jgi:hypothetical protein